MSAAGERGCERREKLGAWRELMESEMEKEKLGIVSHVWELQLLSKGVKERNEVHCL